MWLCHIESRQDANQRASFYSRGWWGSAGGTAQEANSGSNNHGKLELMPNSFSLCQFFFNLKLAATSPP
jgi:hypothetical protein